MAHDSDQIKTLETRIKALESDNEFLADQAEALALLGDIAARIDTLDDPAAILRAGLENLALIKELALASSGCLGRGGITLHHPMGDFAVTINDGARLPLPESLCLDVEEKQSLVGLCRADECGLAEAVGPDAILTVALVATSCTAIPDCVFIFVSDNHDEERLAAMLPLLERACATIVSRLDNIALIEELKRTNRDLDRKVEERTRKLATSEEKYRRLIEDAADAVFIADAESGRIIEANRRAGELLGCPPEEICGMLQSELHPPEEAERYRNIFREHLKTGRAIERDLEVIRKDGTKVPVDISASVIESDGKTLIQGVFSDISERVRAETERRLLATAVEHLTESVFITDAANRIVYVNHAFELMSGYSTSEAIGGTPGLLKSGEHDREFYQELKSTIYAGRVWKGFLVIRKKDGETTEVHATINPIIDHEGKISNFVSVHRDMSREREAERRERQGQRLEALGTMAGGIAHDFNNILTPILGYAELSLAMVPAASPLHHHLEQIDSAAARARELVKQILAVSRNREKTRAPLLLAPIVKEALKLIRGALPATIDIVQEIGAPEVMIEADPTEIHQVVMNLCTNAGLAMEEGGTLKVTISRRTVEADFAAAHPPLPAGPCVKLTVRDTGRGIDPAIIDRIFEPYFTTREEGRGSGLGLAVTHGIITSCNGAITVYSELGHGTEFNLYFPEAKQAQATEDLREPEEIPRGDGEHILLIDDEEEITSLGEKVLSHFGYHVTTANTPSAALAIIEEEAVPFDLVISDMTMPEMTGDRLAAQIREKYPAMPIIITSGFSEQMNHDTAARLGLAAFLEKPASPDRLARAVRRAIDQAKKD